MSRTLTSKKDKIAGAWLGVLLFMRTMPCYLWAYEDFLRPLCAILIMAFCVANMSKDKWTKLIFSLIASAYVWATVFVDHSSVITLFNFFADFILFKFTFKYLFFLQVVFLLAYQVEHPNVQVLKLLPTPLS